MHDKGLKKCSSYIRFISIAIFTQYKNGNNLKSLHRVVILGVLLSYKLVQKSKTPFHVLFVNQERFMFQPGTD